MGNSNRRKYISYSPPNRHTEPAPCGSILKLYCLSSTHGNGSLNGNFCENKNYTRTYNLYNRYNFNDIVHTVVVSLPRRQTLLKVTKEREYESHFSGLIQSTRTIAVSLELAGIVLGQSTFSLRGISIVNKE